MQIFFIRYEENYGVKAATNAVPSESGKQKSKETDDEEGESDETSTDVKKKKKKQRATFRDRKVP